MSLALASKSGIAGRDAEWFSHEPILDASPSQEAAPAPDTLRVVFTYDCNMACKYCQILLNRNETTTGYLDSGLLLRALSFFQGHPKPTVIFTGGEPTVHLRPLSNSIRLTRETLPEARIALFTNGLCGSRSLFPLIEDYGVFPIVSLDGTDLDSNQMRGTNSKQLGNVLRLINDLASRETPFGISSTLTQCNIDSFSDTHLPRMITFRPASIGINRYHPLKQMDAAAISYSGYATSLKRAFDTAFGKVYLENAFRFLHPLLTRTVRGPECCASGRGITVDPSGGVAQCKTLLSMGETLAHVDSLASYTQTREFKKWQKRRPATIAYCADCTYLKLCGGGCAYDSRTLLRNEFAIDPSYCQFVSLILDCIFRQIHQVAISDCNLHHLQLDGHRIIDYAQLSHHISTGRLWSSAGH